MKRELNFKQEIETMDMAAAEAIDAALETGLPAILEPLGVTFELGNRTYYPDEGTYRCPITFAIPGSDRLAFERGAALIGLDAGDFGAEFVAQRGSDEGERYRIVGLNLRARRFPVKVERVSDGRVLTYTAQGVRLGLMELGR
jgi:hypothetical protein